MRRVFEMLRDTWLQATSDPDRRVLIWRVPANAMRLLEAFLEHQRRPGGRQTPDFFLRLTTPYVLGFTYSRALLADMQAGQLAYEQAETAGVESVRPHWEAPPAHDSPHGVMTALQSLARHHRHDLRYLAAVLEPVSCTSGADMEHWIGAALADTGWHDVRLVLIDTVEAPVWKGVVERHSRRVSMLQPPVDMFAITRDVAVQSPGTGPGVVYRQLLADIMVLLQRGSAQDVTQRVDRALAVATAQGWHGQVATLQMMLAGAWLKQGDAERAALFYRSVREAAPTAAGAHAMASPPLVMQSWFGEAGCHLRLDQPGRAVSAYRQAAHAAAHVPSPVLAMEAQRMVGWCLLRDGKRESARTELLNAVQLAIPLSMAERRMTTLPQTLWDLLVLQDRRRCERLQAAGESLLSMSSRLLSKADAAGRKLGPQPRHAAMDEIERGLDHALEQALARAHRRREALIQGGDAFFRSIVDAARRLLDPDWNGLPALGPASSVDTADWTAAASLLGPGTAAPAQTLLPHATGALP